jgi:hypothetical protein
MSIVTRKGIAFVTSLAFPALACAQPQQVPQRAPSPAPVRRPLSGPLPKLEPRGIRVQPARWRVGQRYQVYQRFAQTLDYVDQDCMAGSGCGSADDVYQVEIAHVDSARRVDKLIVRSTPEAGSAFGTPKRCESVVTRGQRLDTKAPDHEFRYLASALFVGQDKALLDLGGLSGHVEVGKSVSFPEAFWKRLTPSGLSPSEKRARLLGVQKNGLAVVELQLTVRKSNEPLKGHTTQWVFKGHLCLDPRGPRLRWIRLRAEGEVFRPQGSPILRASASGHFELELKPLGR